VRDRDNRAGDGGGRSDRPPRQEAAPGTRIFIGNLSWDATNEDLEDLFKGFNPKDIRICTDAMTGRSRGFAFANFDTERDAADVIAKFNGAEVKGRDIKVNVAESKGAGGGGRGGGRGGFRGGDRGGT